MCRITARFESLQNLTRISHARNARHTYVKVSEDKRSWRVQQMLVDAEEHNDWVAEFDVDLGESRKANEPIIRLVRLGNLVIQ